MKQYHELLQHILDNGVKKEDRTGTGTLSVFGHQMRFNLQDGFPLITTKKIHLKSIIHELLWIISGSTNIKYLVDNNVNIWNEWPFQNWLSTMYNLDHYPKYSDAWKEKLAEYVDRVKNDTGFAVNWGDLGPVYGKQWRSWVDHNQFGSETALDWHIDQLNEAINTIKNNPDSRRIMVTAWNPGDIAMVALPPCHCLFQFYVANGRLSCQLYQRSADVFLGVPFNIASYALLTHMIAQVCGLQVGDFIWTGGDTHLYLNHIDQAKLQLSREILPLSEIWINPKNSIDDYQYSDFQINGYNSHPAIKAEVSV